MAFNSFKYVCKCGSTIDLNELYDNNSTKKAFNKSFQWMFEHMDHGGVDELPEKRT